MVLLVDDDLKLGLKLLDYSLIINLLPLNDQQYFVDDMFYIFKYLCRLWC